MANVKALNKVDYSRQAELDGILTQTMPKDEIQVIVGCGGIGFWLGIFLAMLGYSHFILIDGKKVGYSNLNRLPVPQTWVGANKAIALRRVIRSMRIDTIVMVLTTHISKDTLNLLDKTTTRFVSLSNEYNRIRSNVATLWDTTDDARIQVLIHDHVKSMPSMEYRKIGYEAFKIGTYKNYNVWTADGYASGYRTSNANAVTSAIAAGMGIFSRCMTSKDMEIDLKDLIMGKLKPKVEGEEAVQIKKLTQMIHTMRDFVYTEYDAVAELNTYLEQQGV